MLYQKMNRSRLIWLVSFLVSGGLVLFFLWPTKPAPFRLRIIGQTQEQGKTVAQFRVEGGPRRMAISRIVKVVDGAETEAVDMDQFYGFSKTWPLGDPRRALKEFAVAAPTNAPIWKLRVTVSFENASAPGSGERIKNLPVMWKAAKAAGSSFSKACWYSWNSFYGNDSQVLESEPLTNALLQVARPAME